MLTIRGGAPSPTLIVAGNFIAVLSYYKALLQNFRHLFCIFLLCPIKTRHGSDWNLMDQALIYTQRREEKTQNAQLPNLSLPLVKLRNYNNLNRLSLVGRFRVSKYFRHLYRRVLFSNVFSVRRFLSSGPVVTDSAIRESPGFIEEGGDKMEDSIETGNSIQQWKLEFGNNGGGTKTFADLLAERSPERCSRPGSPTWMEGANEEERQGSLRQSSSSLPLDWPLSDGIHGAEKPPLHEMEFEKQDSEISEVARMKERFSKLLLGEDMSGRGNGVCAALAISKAITNLSATLFGKIWKLEPLHPMKKAMWERDKEWLLSVGDHIVEFTPTWQTFPDGSEGEVMTCRPRADLYVNLPALRKLDNMLIETLDSFEDTEFWYANQVIQSPKADGSSSSPGHVHHQEEKCRLPVPHVPPSGLSENSRKHLQQKRDCTNQILKAAQAINNTTLTEMEVPESYLEALPKNVRASLGEVIYRYITSGQFSPEHFLSHLDLTSEQALEVANRVETSINVWHQRHHPKPPSIPSQSTSRSSWETVKELMADAERRESLVERAEILLFCIKQKFPGLPQTTLRTSKIQFNKDIGKSILESYSRVLESLAADILVCIDDLLHMDDLMKPSDQYLPITKVGVTAHESISNPHLLPVSSTSHKTAVTASGVSQGQQVIPAKAETLPFFKYSKLLPRGFSKRKMSTDFRNTEREEKDNDNHTDGSGSISKATEKAMGFLGTKAKWEDENNPMEGSESISKAAGEASAPLTGSQSFELLRNAIKPPSQGSILGLTPSSRTWEDHLLTTRTRKPLDL